MDYEFALYINHNNITLIYFASNQAPGRVAERHSERESCFLKRKPVTNQAK